MPECEPEPLLAGSGLTRAFQVPGGKPLLALQDVTIALRPNHSLAVVGASGSGKTTLARILARLLEPTAGTVLLAGRDVTHLGAPEDRVFRRRVQIVLQDPSRALNPFHTARFILTQPLTVHRIVHGRGERRAHVDWLAEQVGLSPRDLGKYPRQFSAGQRQRLTLARALAVEPEVLILDEPVSALDATVAQQIVALLRELQATRHLSYLLICHDLSLVPQFCGDVVVMEQGQIVERGSIVDLFSHPQHAATIDLLQAMQLMLRPSASFQ